MAFSELVSGVMSAVFWAHNIGANPLTPTPTSVDHRDRSTQVVDKLKAIRKQLDQMEDDLDRLCARASAMDYNINSLAATQGVKRPDQLRDTAARLRDQYDLRRFETKEYLKAPTHDGEEELLEKVINLVELCDALEDDVLTSSTRIGKAYQRSDSLLEDDDPYGNNLPTLTSERTTPEPATPKQGSLSNQQATSVSSPPSTPTQDSFVRKEPVSVSSTADEASSSSLFSDLDYNIQSATPEGIVLKSMPRAWKLLMSRHAPHLLMKEDVVVSGGLLRSPMGAIYRMPKGFHEVHNARTAVGSNTKT